MISSERTTTGLGKTADAAREPRAADGRPRNTNDWYEDRDALSVVDGSLITRLQSLCGPRVLDLGCGLGGYAATLNGLGFDCRATDVNARYVGAALKLGVDATLFDGLRLPYEDRSFDSVFAIEVLEHVREPDALLREVRRVTCGNFVATVPNCTQDWQGAGVVFEHMLDTDHKNFFDVESLRALLTASFKSVQIEQIAPVNRSLARLILPRPLARAYSVALRLKLVRQTHFFRLLADCR